MWSPSYGCFSTGMRDECVKTLIDWQEATQPMQRIGCSCK